MMIAAHRAAVRAETLVSVAINAVVPAAIIRVLAAPPPVALLGDPPLLPGLLLGSGLATLLMTLVVTTLIRGRVRAGRVPPLTTVPAFARWLPATLAARAVVMAGVAVVVLVPLWAALVVGLDLLPLTANRLALFNFVFGASVGLTMTPPVVVRALADPR